MTDLDGKVALVTGASGGIGRRIARELAMQGADVGLLGRSLEAMAEVAKDVERLGVRAEVARLDMRDPTSIAAGIGEVTDALGPADVLVCNSAVSGPATPTWNYALQDFRDVLAVNVTGTFMCCQAVLPSMIERGTGSLVVIGSVAGKRPTQGRSAYSASKAAVIGLVRTIALEAGPFGVRANVVVPGGVAGERLDATVDEVVAATGADPAEVRARYVDGSPLRRLVDPDDIARAVAYLASDRAASITGEDLNVTAGLVMH